MKRVYVDEQWCLGCHLCEYYCAFAKETKGEGESASRALNMVKALKGHPLTPRLRIEEAYGISFAVSCRHCEDPLCVKSCISGALTVRDGVIHIDANRCVGCYTCVLVCPYGAVIPSEQGAVRKCELCVERGGLPACVEGCPNRAIVYEER